MNSRRNNGYTNQDLANLEDDDFDDFGVFEGADPVEGVAASEDQAAVSSWAAFASASARLQPDLLCAQNTFPRYLDPSGIPGVQQAVDGVHSGGSDRLQGSLPLHDGHLSNDTQEHQRSEVEERLFGGGSIPIADVLDGTFTSPSSHGRAGATGNFPASSMLPDIGLGTIQNCAFSEPSAVNSSQNARTSPNPDPPAAEREEISMGQESLLQPQAEESGLDREEVNTAPVPGNESENVVATVDESQQSSLQSELASLQSRNLSLVEELERCQVELENQRLRLQELQRHHAEQLEAVRQSGHDALVVIVEQYKELSKTAVLEQQEISQQHLLKVVQQQEDVMQQVLEHQKQENEKARSEGIRHMKEELQTALDHLHLQHKEQFDVFLTEETRKQEEAIKLALEEERARYQRQIEDIVTAEQAKAKQHLQQAKDDMVRQLEDMQQKHNQVLKEVRLEEREQAQIRLVACLEQERDQSKELMSRVLQEARHEQELYLEQQRQSDAAVRRRYLTSLDLLLESARLQISHMLTSEPHSVPHLQQKEDNS
ncbi:coiled-coil domain-containing protein 91-like isoform X1 [Pomacea canaliculata]|uniref:coiled-coil domain-containing protein 91-like isoform X1 n=1 Tax=Pomacea canaliculata TaxID=400727 RepID=UPI000D7267FA|nr:coiled-coil domain-containing protein 91-like isoform X1 [Pomacea canaliculata]